MQKNLAHTLFPLGDFTKQEVRQMAFDRGYAKLSKKAESQEICFVPNDDYRTFSTKRPILIKNVVSAILSMSRGSR